MSADNLRVHHSGLEFPRLVFKGDQVKTIAAGDKAAEQLEAALKGGYFLSEAEAAAAAAEASAETPAAAPKSPKPAK